MDRLSASGSPRGTSRPVVPWTTSSPRPPTSVATTARPASIASTAASPNASSARGARRRPHEDVQRLQVATRVVAPAGDNQPVADTQLGRQPLELWTRRAVPDQHHVDAGQ